MEAAPTDIAPVGWCDKTTTSIPAVAGWAANAVGKGQANTTAMLGGGCTGVGGASGAGGDSAGVANAYLTATKSDWFLPSLGELMLMYTNLRQAGVGNFTNNDYWSSTESNSNYAWYNSFNFGFQADCTKRRQLPVRAIRAF